MFNRMTSVDRSGERKNRHSSQSEAEGLSKTHYRLVVLGAAGVGKTCIVSQFMYETFLAKYKATVEEFHRGEFDVQGNVITLEIVDTAGGYEFPAMRQLSISTGDAFILVYSVDDQSSFDAVTALRDEILEEKSRKSCAGTKPPPIVIVANKVDLDVGKHQVQAETAETTVGIEWGNGYVEASAKDNLNITAIFRELLRQADVHMDASRPQLTRRDSMPTVGTGRKTSLRKMIKRNSCNTS